MNLNDQENNWQFLQKEPQNTLKRFLEKENMFIYVGTAIFILLEYMKSLKKIFMSFSFNSFQISRIFLKPINRTKVIVKAASKKLK